jgi:fructose-1-phosphate kinase PfkB-like protein
MFAALEDLGIEVEINTISERIRENIKISAKDRRSIIHGWIKGDHNY